VVTTRCQVGERVRLLRVRGTQQPDPRVAGSPRPAHPHEITARQPSRDRRQRSPRPQPAPLLKVRPRTKGSLHGVTACQKPPIYGGFRSDDGTRTHDLLHGKCRRAFAPVRARSLKRLDCRTFPRIERTRPHPSERRPLPFLPRNSAAGVQRPPERARLLGGGVSGSSQRKRLRRACPPKSASQLGSLSSAARGPRTRRRGERSL
jgi:hypothetical protein